MLANGRLATRVPAQNLERAKAYYAEKLSGDHTQMGWEADDIEAAVRELRARGVVFEEYDLPGLRTVEGIADIAGNYPSKGRGERGAWFRDSEGNMLGIGQPIR
jgi:hypothetical protein